MLETHTKPAIATRPKRILLVDPSRDDRMEMRDKLRDTELPLEVTVTPSIGTARALLDCNDYDCTLVCLSLARDDALGFIQEAAATTTVVAMSSGDMSLTGTAARAGAQDILVKSQVNADRLRKSIEEGISQRRKGSDFRRNSPTLQIAIPDRTATTELTTDPLTRLRNREGFDHRLRELTLSVAASGGYSVAVVEVDQLMEYEFVHGDEMRDALFKEVARYLKSMSSAMDTVARFDETRFGLILTEDEIMDAMMFSERLRIGLSKALDPRFDGISASFGVASFDPATGSPDSVVQAAEAGLKVAQRRGGGVGVTATEDA